MTLWQCTKHHILHFFNIHSLFAEGIWENDRLVDFGLKCNDCEWSDMKDMIEGVTVARYGNEK